MKRHAKGDAQESAFRTDCAAMTAGNLTKVIKAMLMNTVAHCHLDTLNMTYITRMLRHKHR